MKPVKTFITNDLASWGKQIAFLGEWDQNNGPTKTNTGQEGGKYGSGHYLFPGVKECILLIPTTRDLLQMQQWILFPTVMPRNINEHITEKTERVVSSG